MFLVILAAAIGTALGLILRGGRIQLRTDLRALPAVALGAVFLVAAEWLPIPGKAGVFIVGTALVVVGLLQNLQVSGAVVTSIGLFLTGFAVLVNGYLPLRTEAAEATNTTASGLRQDETEGSTLGILGDVVPLGPWVLSFGDLIATAGAFILGRDLVRKDERISADDFLAQFTILDEPHVDLNKLRREPDPSRPTPPTIDLRDQPARPPQPTIDLRDQPAPPPPTKADRFIQIESRDDRQS